jgi:hypothetical protein
MADRRLDVPQIDHGIDAIMSVSIPDVLAADPEELT